MQRPLCLGQHALPGWHDCTQHIGANLSCCAQLCSNLAVYVGMDFYVVLERPGYRVGRRRRAVSTVGIQHKVTKDDAQKWYAYVSDT